MAELKSKAEQMADKARDLPAFKKISLPGIKDNVAEILGMIGRVEGIFQHTPPMISPT